MLGIVALDAVKEGLITSEELAEGHTEFLTSMVPYLAAINFSNRETSGTWEENPALKTSVLAVETALLHKVHTYMNEPGMEFLQVGYQKAKHDGHLSKTFDDLGFGTAVDIMIHQGLGKIGAQFPFESPFYNEDGQWIQRRGVDVTLLYLLDYGIPQLLEQYEVPIHVRGRVLTRKEIEKEILEAVETLYDPKLHGYKRYIGDSYHALNFWTREKQQVVRDQKNRVQQEAIDGSRPVNLHDKQLLRYEAFEPEHEAVWFHPNSQVVNWAVRSFRETGDEWYAEVAQKYYNRLLATLTGEKEYHVVLDGTTSSNEIRHNIKQVPAFRWAESATKRRTSEGGIITVIGPFIPFNWGTGLAALATAGMVETFAGNKREEEAVTSSELVQEKVLVEL